MPTALPPAAPSSVTTDPLAALLIGAMGRTRNRALPLIATAFDVTIESGLAAVETRRVFRNDEAGSIEATITFPLPIHATLYALEARIDGRSGASGRGSPTRTRWNAARPRSCTRRCSAACTCCRSARSRPAPRSRW
jgi:hypothetical protein